MKVTVEEVKTAIREAAVAGGACKAILFGSFARGTATDRSDVDVVFVEETSERFLARLGKYMDPLFDRLKLAADVFVYTPAEYERMLGRFFMDRVLREGIVVYER
jgi:predicted nucleotidyltransferase